MFLNIFLEVILITILVGGSYYGYNKGFFKMAAGPVRLLLCVAVSFAFSRTVGDYFVAPIIRSHMDEGIAYFADPAISAASTALGFILLFVLARIVLSFVISLINRFLDEGIIGKINRASGFLLAGVIALLGAMCFASLAEYIFMLSVFDNSDLLKDFSGGPLYHLFTFISPVGLIFTQ